ncbi:hypothetical protein [Vreelandella nigrificans]|uniref:Uncharacterized protein n=1 Tax=Vreelandella nigrificans TaxID=2042704 RepID=A0A2A4HH22_9GAMM|nr:hypothetical protein [Halomonas nigrificans]PCF94070.1 hypothetical protein CPA45_19010 [Halomonas nigrificans]
MNSSNDESPDTIVAEHDDHPPKPKSSGKSRVKSRSKMPLPVKAGVGGVVLVGGFLILVALIRGESSGEEKFENLKMDVAGTRADLLLIEERLTQFEGFEERLKRLDEGGDVLRENLEGLNGYETRMDALEQRINQFSSQVELQMVAFSERLENKLEESEAAVEAAEQQAQLARDEARRAASAQAEAERLAARSTSQSQTSTRPVSPARPPFSISGVEFRGGRNFLSIASGPVNSLGDVKLLGERDSEGEWQLVNIGSSSAEFYYRGRSVTVPLP